MPHSVAPIRAHICFYTNTLRIPTLKRYTPYSTEIGGLTRKFVPIYYSETCMTHQVLR
jgi:hypothetical protein